MDNPLKTNIIASILGGSFAAILTHPVDTAKTCVQSDLVGDKYSNATWTAKHLFNKGGLPILFKVMYIHICAFSFIYCVFLCY